MLGCGRGNSVRSVQSRKAEMALEVTGSWAEAAVSLRMEGGAEGLRLYPGNKGRGLCCAGDSVLIRPEIGGREGMEVVLWEVGPGLMGGA